MTHRTDVASLEHEVSPEDHVRADFYALISRLFFAGPDADLLAAIAELAT